MAALGLFRERRDGEKSSGSRPASLDACTSSSAATSQAEARVSRLRKSGRAWTAAFWVCAAFALSGIGIAIGIALESALLGFLGADFVFLLVVAAFMSSPGARRRRH